MDQLRAVSVLAILLCVRAVGVAQSKTLGTTPLRTSVCELIKHGQRFAGKTVAVHARYIVNWEWGGWLSDSECNHGLRLAYPYGEGIPSRYSQLKVNRDSDYRLFEEQRQLLCTGISGEQCTFDFVEADFTGVYRPVKAKAPFQDADVLIVTDIKNVISQPTSPTSSGHPIRVEK